MGENQGVIWVLIGALVLGVAIFAMGKYFSRQTESQQTSIAFQQQTAVDEAACETRESNGIKGEFHVDQSLNIVGWTATTSSGTSMSTGTCSI